MRVIGKRVIIIPVIEESTTEGGIILNSDITDRVNGHTRTGKVTHSNVDELAVGSTVYYSQFSGVPYKDYLILEEKEVLAYVD